MNILNLNARHWLRQTPGQLCDKHEHEQRPPVEVLYLTNDVRLARLDGRQTPTKSLPSFSRLPGYLAGCFNLALRGKSCRLYYPRDR